MIKEDADWLTLMLAGNSAGDYTSFGTVFQSRVQRREIKSSLFKSRKVLKALLFISYII